MTYTEALIEALTNKELVTSYDRLSGSGLGEVIKAINQGGLNFQIDQATGRTKDEILKFVKFFDEFIWDRLPPEAFVTADKIQVLSDEGGLYVVVDGKKIYEKKESIDFSALFQDKTKQDEKEGK